MSINASKDFAPVVLLMSTPLMLVTDINSPYRTVAQFVADAKARPGKISLASDGNATMTLLLAEQFQMHAGNAHPGGRQLPRAGRTEATRRPQNQPPLAVIRPPTRHGGGHY